MQGRMNSSGGKILLFDTASKQASELPIEDYGDMKLMGPHGISSWKESGAFIGFTYLYNAYKSYIVRRVLAAIIVFWIWRGFVLTTPYLVLIKLSATGNNKNCFF